MKEFTLTLSLSKGERRPKAAKDEGGRSHFFNSLLEPIAPVVRRLPIRGQTQRVKSGRLSYRPGFAVPVFRLPSTFPRGPFLFSATE